MEISLVFEDGLSKSTVATMAGGSISATDLPSYILDGLLYFEIEKIHCMISTLCDLTDLGA